MQEEDPVHQERQAHDRRGGAWLGQLRMCQERRIQNGKVQRVEEFRPNILLTILLPKLTFPSLV